MPCVFNSVDEVAVDKFLKGKIKYLDISDMIEDAMNNFKFIENPTIEEILETDKEVREWAEKRSW